MTDLENCYDNWFELLENKEIKSFRRIDNKNTMTTILIIRNFEGTEYKRVFDFNGSFIMNIEEK